MVQRCKFSIELKNFPPDLSGEPFYRRNSIEYDVDIVFRLCFCNSKNTIYFVDIQLFIRNITKKETP